MISVSVWSILRINRAQTERIQELSHSVFLYSVADKTATSMANALKEIKGMRTVTVESPEASAIVHSMSGEAKVMVPALLVPSAQGTQHFSGMFAISTALDPFLTPNNAFSGGAKAIIVILGIAIGALFIASELTSITRLFTPLQVLLPWPSLWGHVFVVRRAGRGFPLCFLS